MGWALVGGCTHHRRRASLGHVGSHLEEREPSAHDTERRLAEFTELVATAIANSEAHERLAQLADEQVALRRVATLVAEGRLRTVCSTPCDTRWHGCSTPQSAC